MKIAKSTLIRLSFSGRPTNSQNNIDFKRLKGNSIVMIIDFMTMNVCLFARLRSIYTKYN